VAEAASPSSTIRHLVGTTTNADIIATLNKTKIILPMGHQRHVAVPEVAIVEVETAEVETVEVATVEVATVEVAAAEVATTTHLSTSIKRRVTITTALPNKRAMTRAKKTNVMVTLPEDHDLRPTSQSKPTIRTTSKNTQLSSKRDVHTHNSTITITSNGLITATIITIRSSTTMKVCPNSEDEVSEA